MTEEFKRARLYAITTPPRPGEAYEERVEKALAGGADVVQLRDKNLSGAELFRAAVSLRKICEARGALFVLNDRLDVALAAGAHGVHLGQDDLPVAQARRLADRNYPDRPFLIGCSTHSLAQALKAEQDGADYAGCGPVFSTPTKPDYPAQGLDLVRQYRARVRIPFVGIGGIDETNIERVLEAGASCVAVVRAIFEKPDIEAAARTLKRSIEGHAERSEASGDEILRFAQDDPSGQILRLSASE